MYTMYEKIIVKKYAVAVEILIIYMQIQVCHNAKLSRSANNEWINQSMNQWINEKYGWNPLW